MFLRKSIVQTKFVELSRLDFVIFDQSGIENLIIFQNFAKIGDFSKNNNTKKLK